MATAGLGKVVSGGGAGAFVRPDSKWRHVLGGTDFPFESGRYILYLAHACPWCAGVYSAVKYLNLESKLRSVCVVHPTMQKTRPDDPSDSHIGWTFCKPDKGLIPVAHSQNNDGVINLEIKNSLSMEDTGIHKVKYIRDLYELQKKDFEGRFSVPILWDTKGDVIVNNESSDMIQMFNEWGKKEEMTDTNTNNPMKKDLFPPSHDQELATFVYENINNGVYRCGFATSQSAYDEAAGKLENAMKVLEDRLTKKTQKFLLGDTVTYVDLRLYQTLIRLDEVYVVYFKCPFVSLNYFPNLFKYIARMYQIDAFRQATDMDSIKQHYFTSHPKLNAYCIIPKSTNILQRLADMKLEE